MSQLLQVMEYSTSGLHPVSIRLAMVEAMQPEGDRTEIILQSMIRYTVDLPYEECVQRWLDALSLERQVILPLSMMR